MSDQRLGNAWLEEAVVRHEIKVAVKEESARVKLARQASWWQIRRSRVPIGCLQKMKQCETQALDILLRPVQLQGGGLPAGFPHCLMPADKLRQFDPTRGV